MPTPKPTLVPGTMPPPPPFTVAKSESMGTKQTPARILHDLTMMAKDIDALYVLRTQLNTMYVNEQLTGDQFDKGNIITNARIDHIRKLMALAIDQLPGSGEFTDVAR